MQDIFLAIFAFAQKYTIISIKIIGVILAVEVFAEVFIRRLAKGARSRVLGIGDQQRAETLIKSFSGFLRTCLRIVAILVILPEFGINTTPLLASAGILGVGMGLASKDFVQDFVAGLFILLDDQFRIGDHVKIENIEGEIVDMTMRRTIINGQDGRQYFVPNNLIKISSKLISKKSL